MPDTVEDEQSIIGAEACAASGVDASAAIRTGDVDEPCGSMNSGDVEFTLKRADRTKTLAGRVDVDALGRFDDAKRGPVTSETDRFICHRAPSYSPLDSEISRSARVLFASLTSAAGVKSIIVSDLRANDRGLNKISQTSRR